jgi:hypothetical protein
MLRLTVTEKTDGKLFSVYNDSEILYFLFANKHQDLFCTVPNSSEWTSLIDDDNYETQFNRVMDALPILLEYPIMEYFLNPFDNS